MTRQPTGIRYEVADGIAHLILDGPAQLNAIADETARELADALARFDADPGVHVAILRGEGRAFCSGADVRRRQLRPKEEIERLGGAQARGTRLDQMFFGQTNSKPIIAAVHGYATGLGFVLALLCDLLVADEQARFQMTEVTRGLGAEHARALLAERGAGRIADDLAITGRFCDAVEGHSAGFVHRISRGDLVGDAVEVAAQIMRNAPLSVRGMVAFRRGLAEDAWQLAKSRGPRGLHLTNDFRESALAFAEKRQPDFTAS